MTKHRAWNSTLPAPTKPMKKTALRRRDFRKRDPERYGELWDRVRKMPCFVRELFSEFHRCGLGYAPASAHHVIPKGKDWEGLVPACGAVHDVLEAQKRRELVDLSSVCGGRSISVNIRKLGLEYVDRAKEEEEGFGC